MRAFDCCLALVLCVWLDSLLLKFDLGHALILGAPLTVRAYNYTWLSVARGLMFMGDDDALLLKMPRCRAIVRGLFRASAPAS